MTSKIPVSVRLSKRKLVNMIKGHRMASRQMENKIQNLQGQIRNFRVKLLKIKREVDYLLQHPWSENLTYRKLVK